MTGKGREPSAPSLLTLPPLWAHHAGQPVQATAPPFPAWSRLFQSGPVTGALHGAELIKVLIRQSSN